MGNIINKHQSAYIKGMYIGEIARIILDIHYYYEENYLDGILLFSDIEKAFDSIGWNFLFKQAVNSLNAQDQDLM